MRDIIFNISRRNITVVHYHILFWTIFILYEITLAAAIRERFNHFADYFLHYLLNILLFYVHCYVVLGNKRFKQISDYRKLLLHLLLVISCYYLISVGINKLLVSSGIPVNVTDSSSRLFQLAIVYRCIYIMGLSTAYRVTLNLIKNRQRIHDYNTQTLIAEKEKATLRMELASSELAFLRSQINPHLIFSCLTSIYNRVRKKDTVSAEYLLAMAELMRSALKSRNSTDEVLLVSEIKHITNYIGLQGMSYSPVINFNTSIDDFELKIIPMLLITLIENIFQHGDLQHPHTIPLIEIETFQGELTLRTKNYIRADHTPGNGVGLANTRKRLDFHYRHRYLFEYFADQDIFKLKLVIKLK